MYLPIEKGHMFAKNKPALHSWAEARFAISLLLSARILPSTRPCFTHDPIFDRY